MNLKILTVALAVAMFTFACGENRKNTPVDVHPVVEHCIQTSRQELKYWVLENRCASTEILNRQDRILEQQDEILRRLEEGD